MQCIYYQFDVEYYASYVDRVLATDGEGNGGCGRLNGDGGSHGCTANTGDGDFTPMDWDGNGYSGFRLDKILLC